MTTVATIQERPYQRWTRILAITVLAPLLAIAILPVAIHVVQKPDLGFSLRGLTVQHVEADGPARVAGLQVGDRVVSANDHPISSMEEWFAATAGNYGLGPRKLIVDRGGRLFPATIQPVRPSRSHMVYDLNTWLAGLAFLMIGWWVLVRRRDEVGRDFFGLCFIFAFFLSDIPDLPSVPYQSGKQMLREVLQYLWPAYFLRFFVVFPATGAVAREASRRWIFAPAGILALATLGARFVKLDPTSPVVAGLQFVAQIYLLVYFAAGLVVFARKVLKRDRPVLHTKMRVILLGITLGMVPFLVAFAAASGLIPAFRHWEYFGFSLLLIPISFGLAIMRYGALDTAFVVRTSLIYGVLTVVVLAGYLITVGLLGGLLTRTYQVSAYPALVTVIAACSLVVLPLRRRVQGWVDAAFYPSRQATRDTIAALGRALAVQIDPDEAHDMLLARLYHLYRPSKLVLYVAPNPDDTHLRDHGRRPDSLSIGHDLPQDDPLLEFLDRLRRPVFTEEFEDWLSTPGGHRQPTSVPLNSTVLLVPLVTSNRLLGLLLLGAKTDGALYSQDDLANLANLAVQVGPVLESLRLHAESLRRYQLETELSVARDIQARLLPRHPLEISGVRICGKNDPCRHVGGDYFDYFPLGDTALGFCIADVAGKGIPAALLMTTIRVTFRELAQPGVPPEVVIAELDRRVGEITSNDRFVCVFYGVLELASGHLTFCNGGLEPPLLFRNDGHCDELRRGGPLLGIGAGVPYIRGTTVLEPGDLLLGYTDGITEQTRAGGDEFFEVERLETMVAGGRNESPEVICGQIFSGVDAFGGGEASDDRTVIALQYK